MLFHRLLLEDSLLNKTLNVLILLILFHIDIKGQILHALGLNFMVLRAPKQMVGFLSDLVVTDN